LATFQNNQSGVLLREIRDLHRSLRATNWPQHLHWNFTNPFGGTILEALLRIVNKKERVSQAIPQEEKSASYRDNFSGLVANDMISKTEQPEASFCDNMGSLNIRGPELFDTVNLAVRYDIA